MEVFMATATPSTSKKVQVSNRIVEEHSEMLDLLERLLVIANDERYRNLSRFNRMRELLNEWDDEETDR
jgi:sulfite reductase beta subunit-like hemoprotein